MILEHVKFAFEMYLSLCNVDVVTWCIILHVSKLSVLQPKCAWARYIYTCKTFLLIVSVDRSIGLGLALVHWIP